MSRTFIATITLSLLIALATSVYFYRLRDNTKDIVIAASIPLRTSTGEQVFNAATLAIDERRADFLNSHNETIVFNVKDDTEKDSWNEVLLRLNLQSFIADPDTLAYFGPIHSLAAKIIIPILNRAGIPMISPTNSLPSLTREGYALGEPGIFYPTKKRNYVRLSQTDDIELAEIAALGRDIGSKKAVVVDDRTIDYVSVLTLLRDFREGASIATERITIDRNSNVDTIAQKINGQKADLLVYIGTSPDSFGTFVNALNTTKYHGHIVMSQSTSASPDLIPVAKTLEGMYIIGSNISKASVNNDRMNGFIKVYTARYGQAPALYPAGTSYESMNILLDAIENSDNTRAGVIDKLLKTKDRPSMFGPITFDEFGDSNLHYTSRMIQHNGVLLPYVGTTTEIHIDTHGTPVKS